MRVFIYELIFIYQPVKGSMQRLHYPFFYRTLGKGTQPCNPTAKKKASYSFFRQQQDKQQTTG